MVMCRICGILFLADQAAVVRIRMWDVVTNNREIEIEPVELDSN